MRRLFSIEGEVYAGFTFLYKLMLLNLYFIIGSLGIVTIGVSLTSLYYCVMKIYQKEDGNLWKDFSKSYQENLKQGLRLTLILLVSLALSVGIIGVGSVVLSNQFVILLGLLCCTILSFVSIYSFMLLGQFHNSTKKILVNSFLLLLKNVGVAIAIFLIPIFFLIIIPYYAPSVFLIILLMGLSSVAFLQIYFFKKVIQEFL